MRACFLLKVKKHRIEEYRARHREVWPEMLDALTNAGWRNYTLFLRPDGLLVGYLESDNFAEAQAAMNVTDVNRRWQAEMAEFFDGSTPNQGFFQLQEVFHLD